MSRTPVCQNHSALVAPNRCRVCHGQFCVTCIDSADGRGYCPSCRPESGETTRVRDSAQAWFTVWSLVFFAAGLAFLFAMIALAQTLSRIDSDLQYELGFQLGAVGLLIILGGLILGVLGLRRPSDRHRLAIFAVILNSVNILVALVGVGAGWFQS